MLNEAKQEAIRAMEAEVRALDARIGRLKQDLRSATDAGEMSQIGEDLARASQDRKDAADLLASLQVQNVRVEELTDEERRELAEAIADLDPAVGEDQALHARLDAAQSILSLLKGA